MGSSYARALMAAIAMTLFFVPSGMISGSEDDVYEAPFDVIQLTIEGGLDAVFIENRGQWDPEVMFVARTGYGQVGFTKDGIYHNVVIVERTEPERRGMTGAASADSCLVGIGFSGSNPATPVGVDVLPTEYNYFLGSDPSRWASGVSAYSSIVYRDLWDGIDLIYKGGPDGLKYDIVLRPGADPDSVRFEVDDSTLLSVRGDSLHIGTPLGMDLVDGGLRTFYMDTMEPIPSSFSLDGGLFGFSLSSYDKDRSVVIDPTVNLLALNFSTFIGGSSSDYPYEMDVDASGNVFVCGATYSTNFPTIRGQSYQERINGYGDAFVLKLDSAGRSLLICTYIGGSSSDEATSIKVDDNGDCYVAGVTTSEDFPTTKDAYNDTLYSSSLDLFILKLNSRGSDLIYSTYLGGADYDYFPRIDIDDSGNVYLAASTISDNFPITSNAYQNTLIPDPWGGWAWDMVFLKMDLSKMDLIYSSYLGGEGSDISTSIRYDDAGSVYMGGYTDSSDFNVTSGAYQGTINGRTDGFVFKFDMTAKSMTYCTYFGGTSGSTYISDMDIDESGNVYACGETDSQNLPVTIGAYDAQMDGGADAFVMRLNSAGSGLVFCTFAGGSGYESFQGISLDDELDIHLSGYIYDTFDFPMPNGVFQPSAGGGLQEGVYMKLSNDGSENLYSTYVGGVSYDECTDVVVCPNSQEPIVLGSTSSSDFPTKGGSYDTTHNGADDIFVLKLILSLPPDPPGTPVASAGDSFVNLSWDPPAIDGGAPVTDYEVHRGTKSGSLSRIAFTEGNSSYNDTSVTNGIKYYYAVLAVNRMGPGKLSDEIIALPATVPTPPRNVVARYSNRFVNLTWIAPEDDGGLVLQGFYLYKFTGSSQTPEVSTIEPYIKTYSDESVTNGINYRYFLTAFNTMGESPPSIEVNATPRTRPGMVEDVVISTGPEFISLRWSAPEWDGGSPILNYTIFRAVQSGSFARYVTLPAMPRIFNDTGLENGLRYRYKLIALNSEGSGDPTDEVSAVPLDRPSMPTNFEVEAFSNSVKITWGQPLRDGGTPVLGFNIYRAEKSMIWSNIRELDVLDESYTDNSVINGRTYIYRMTALNDVGESEHTEEINVTPLGRPGSPMGYNIEAGDRFVILSWETPLDHGGTPVTGFKVFRGESSQEMGLYATIEGPEHTYNDTKVKNGLTYYYKVAATNAVGDGPFTEAKSARPAWVPSPPSNVQVTPGDGFVDISWGPPMNDGGDPVTELRIFRGTDPNSSVPLLTSSVLTGSYRDTTVTNGVEYYYSMSSSNSIGESIRTTPAPAMPSGKPTAPRNVISTAGSGSVRVTWDAPSSTGGLPLTGYNIYRTSTTKGSILIGDVGPDVLEYSDRNVVSGGTYLYRISAVNANGEGPQSESVEAYITEKADHTLVIVVASMIVLVMIILAIALAVFLSRKKKKQQQMPQQAPAPGMMAPPPYPLAAGQAYPGMMMPAPSTPLPPGTPQEGLPPSEPRVSLPVYQNEEAPVEDEPEKSDPGEHVQQEENEGTSVEPPIDASPEPEVQDDDPLKGFYNEEQ
ncbi:MAG: fibronectin type III domain-containing protein [Candidatus Thermoplasmatota archaeon]|nr:fibronectin type III domain-containing protein [Candidatus Thermoplasmatota archaeon]